MEVGSMYEVALRAMGPRFGVQIKKNIDFHKMELWVQDWVYE